LPHARYFTLAEAFDRFGKLTCGSEWSGEELGIERPFVPFVSTWSPESNVEARYKAVRLGLLECFWASPDGHEAPIEAVGIEPSGKTCSIPHWVWKCETDEFLISLGGGRVRYQREEGSPTIRVRVPRPDFDRMLYDRYSHGAGQNSVRSGAPRINDWTAVGREILDLFLSDSPPRSASQCSEMLIGRLGDAAPVDSQIRSRVSDMKLHGVIEF
jgi:hypothetical protein